MHNIFTTHLAIQEKYSARKSEIRASLNSTEALKQLIREKEKEQTESRDSLFNELPERARRRIALGVISDYQRHGIQVAWFSEKNRELLEVPPDEDDLACLREQSKEAREHLEERVYQIFKKFMSEHFAPHFEPNSREIRWAYRKYPLQIPPVELIGVERDKGDFREQK